MRIKSRKTSILQGVIKPPSSKSEAIRALFFALLSPGTSHIHEILEAEDVTEALLVCQALGATVERNGTSLALTSPGFPFSPCSPTLYTGQSGLTTRLLLPILGLCVPQPLFLDCAPSMRARPMHGLINTLNQLGMHINSSQWPLCISGNLSGGEATLTEPISQFVSALLMALPLAEKTSSLITPIIPSWSYVEMTLAWLKRLNIAFTHTQHDDAHHFTLPGKQHYKPFEVTLPNDFSSASYFIAAATLLPGSVRIEGLDMKETQGDKQLISIIQAMGGDISLDGTTLIIHGGKPLQGIRIDASNIPDLLPTLAVLGTAASGKTEIYNVMQARLKETDRIHSMTEGLSRMGAIIEEKNDGMVIYASPLRGAEVKGYGDHRTVMSLSLAGMLAEGETSINDAESIRKTFPDFVSDMRSLGAHLEITS